MAKKKKRPSVTTESPMGSHVRLSVEHLRGRLAMLKGIPPRRAHNKQKGCYHLAVEPDGTATLGAMGVFSQMRLKLEVMRASGHGTLLLDSHAMDAILASYPAPTIQLALDGTKADEVEATGHGIKVILPALDAKTELKEPVRGCESDSGWMVTGEDLARGLALTKWAAEPPKEGNTRFSMAGVLLDFGDGRLTMVATDGRRMSRVDIPARPHGEPIRRWRPAREGKAHTDGLPLLAWGGVVETLRLARAVGEKTLAIAILPGTPTTIGGDNYEGGELQVVTDDAVLTTPIPDGRFPIYKDVWPDGDPLATLMMPDARLLEDLLDAAVAAIDSESKGVEMVLADGNLMVYAESGTKGKTELFLHVPESTGRATVVLDPRYLREALHAIGQGSLVMELRGPAVPILIKSGPDFQHILMPHATPEEIRAAERAEAEETRAHEAEMAEYDARTAAQIYGDEAEEEGEGDVADEPEPEPVPAAPVAATKPKAHERNGKAKAKPKPKGKGGKK